MGARTVCAAFVCKATYHALRLLGRGGTSLPGKLALKIDPNYLHQLSRGVRTIVITGTNGKTTSTHIVAQALENMGEEAFYNRSGANLIQGITTEFAIRSSMTGKPRYKLAAIECDEGALRRVCKRSTPTFSSSRTSFATSSIAMARSRIRSKTSWRASRTLRMRRFASTRMTRWSPRLPEKLITTSSSMA